MRYHRTRAALLPALLLPVIVLLGPTARAQDEYTFTLVDAFATDYGLRECYLWDINASGQACGTATIEIPWQGGTMITYTGFYWSADGVKTPIPLSWPRGISDNGKVAGVTAIFDIPLGQTTSVPLLPGTYMPLVLLDVNDAGVAVGYVQICNCSNSQGMLQIPYVWDAVNGARSIAIAGANGASRITDSGLVIGWIGGNNASNGYLHDLTTGETTLMSSLFAGPNIQTQAVDVTEDGVVLGWRKENNGNVTYGFTWSAGAGVTYLPLPPAGYQPHLRPARMNSSGVVVGQIYTPTGSSRAFVYDDAHGIRDLNTLTTPTPGFTMLAASGINESGWIVGYGNGGGGMYRSFVLRPRVTGDLDGDGDVDQADLALLLSCYGLPDDCGDVDGDGDTDQADLAALLANYGS